MIKKVAIVMLVIMAFFSVGGVVLAADNPYYNVIYNCVYSATGQVSYSDYVTRCILYYSQVYQVDPLLVCSLFKQESSFSMSAVSPVGAIGIAQLMPATAQSLGVNPYDTQQNIEGGIKYLSQQLHTYSKYGDWMATYAIAAYNAGPGSIVNGSLPPYQETYWHIVQIHDCYMSLLKSIG